MYEGVREEDGGAFLDVRGRRTATSSSPATSCGFFSAVEGRAKREGVREGTAVALETSVENG